MVRRSRVFLKGSCTDGKEANSAAALAVNGMGPLKAGKRSLLRAGVLR